MSSSSLAIIHSSFKHYNRQAFQVRAQSHRDGAAGRSSSNGVDANLMRVLKGRIEQVKIKEKLERCCCCCSRSFDDDDDYGWKYYENNYDNYKKIKRDLEISKLFEILNLVGSTIGFTCFTGTLFICLVSIFLHLHQ